MESNGVAKLFKHEKFSGMAFQVRNSLFSALLSNIPFSNRLFFNVFQVNFKVNKLLFPN